jgi:hypothetical protein
MLRDLTYHCQENESSKCSHAHTDFHEMPSSLFEFLSVGKWQVDTTVSRTINKSDIYESSMRNGTLHSHTVLLGKARRLGKARERKNERGRKGYRVGEWEGGRQRRRETTDEIQKKWKHSEDKFLQENGF